jgi:hypothetical protein
MKNHARTEKTQNPNFGMLPDVLQLYTTTHGTRRQDPAEKCGIKVEGNNKWLTLIQNASKKSWTTLFLLFILH